jgi:hypothetical protein
MGHCVDGYLPSSSFKCDCGSARLVTALLREAPPPLSPKCAKVTIFSGSHYGKICVGVSGPEKRFHENRQVHGNEAKCSTEEISWAIVEQLPET